jgi:hypothetical protein
MESLKLKAYIGEDGLLKINLPIINQDIEVMVIYQAVNKTEKKQWSPEFFEKTSGCWKGKTLVREIQPEDQEREPLL